MATFSYREIIREEVTATDQLRESADWARDGYPVRHYRITPEGSTEEGQATVLGNGRAAIAWGGDSAWLDAEGIESLMQQWEEW